MGKPLYNGNFFVSVQSLFFNILRRFCLLILAATSFVAHATDTSDGVFHPAIRTVSLRNADNFMAPPVIRLGTNDQLVLNFDIISEQHQYLCYRLIHCNADWQPSQLLESEYVDGFNEGRIEDFAYSANTYIHYVNYNLIFPNEDMPILSGGNYLLQVYDEDDPSTVLLQTRFSVTENRIKLLPQLTTHTDRGFNTEWQQVDLAIDYSGMENVNPYSDFLVTVTQNNRPETTQTVSHPLRVENSTMIYAHDANLIFPASNEYRRFETVRSDYPGMSVDSVIFGGSNWHAYLRLDSPRAHQSYIYDRTQHGRFKVDEYNSTNPDLGADYVTVHFTLDSPEIIDHDIYVDGDFNLHRFDHINRMLYDPVDGVYRAAIPLKQGSYNYQYVAMADHGKGATGYSSLSADATMIEGNFYETENEYLIKVFFRQPGSRADRLVGYGLLK